MRQVWDVLKQSVNEFVEDEAMTLAGALAFYGALSLAPLLLIAITLAGLAGQGTQQQVVAQIERVVGADAGAAIDMVITNAQQQQNLTTVSGVVGVAALLISASAVFAQLQTSMNRIWDVKAAPGQGVWGWLRKRATAMVVVLGVLALLLVAVGASSVLGVILRGTGIPWPVIDILLSAAIFTAMFAVVFRFMPDVEIEWKNVWAGAAVTAVLFVAGKQLIGYYLSTASVGSAYGAAGSLIALLVWLYYSALIFFLGAEITQVYARRIGSRIEPSRHAVWADPQERKRAA